MTLPQPSNLANRNRRETQGIIGLFTNFLPLRNDLSGNPTFRELLARVRQSSIEAFGHQELPVELLMRELQPGHDLIRFPGVYVGLQLRAAPPRPRCRVTAAWSLPSGLHRIDSLVSRYDMWLTFTETDHGMLGELAYDTSLFDAATIVQWGEQIQTLLEGIVADPDRRLSELSLLCDQERSLAVVAPSAADLAGQIEAGERGETDGRPQNAPWVQEFAASLLGPSQRRWPVAGPTCAPADRAPPLFCIHGLGGHVAGFLPLARGLADVGPSTACKAWGSMPGQQPHDRIEAMAELYLSEIRQVQPHGPYLLAGWSLGGLIALEAAQQLPAAGEEVALVAMFDTLSFAGRLWQARSGRPVGDPLDRPAVESFGEGAEKAAAGSAVGADCRAGEPGRTGSAWPRFAGWPRCARHIWPPPHAIGHSPTTAGPCSSRPTTGAVGWIDGGSRSAPGCTSKRCPAITTACCANRTCDVLAERWTNISTQDAATSEQMRWAPPIAAWRGTDETDSVSYCGRHGGSCCWPAWSAASAAPPASGCWP